MTGLDAAVRRACITAGVCMAISNVIGATIAFVYLGILSPTPASVSAVERRQLLEATALVFVPFMVVTLVVVGFLLRRQMMAVTWWAVEDRPPTPTEVDGVLRLPRDLLLWPVSTWAVSAVLFALLPVAFELPWVLAVRVSTGIMLAGAITCVLCYLVTERVLRPVAATVLAYGVPDRPRAPGILPRLVMSWLLGAALPLLAIGLTQIFRTPEERQHLLGPIWFLVVTGVLTGALAISVAALSVSSPIRRLREAQRAVQRGRLDVTVEVDDASEVGQLQAGFNEMVAGLRERSRLEDLFGRHVGTDVARQALARGVALGGEQRDASVLFVDVVGSTAMAQSQRPDEVVATLNAFFAAVVEAVRAEGGWVNKFAGDGALCVFGAPGDLPGHPTAALRAGCSLRRALPEGIDAGIGISCGTVTAGNVGAEERFEYTVIGDPVNEAARLSDLAKIHRARVLAAETVVRAADHAEAAHWVPDGQETLRGRATPTEIYVPK